MHKSEPKPSRRLRLAASFLVGLWAVAPGWVNALPNGGTIVSGTGSIDQPTAQEMLIQQDSQRLITNWQGFSIDAAESVTFNQPNSSAVALNRVIGVDPSIILGKLSANGQVFLTNPSGVVFGKDAVVDVHGLLATTLNIQDQDFLKDNYQFIQDPTRSLASIINNGTLNAARYVGLAAPTVENSGSIVVADLGSVALASGTAVTLDFNGDGLISFAVNDAQDSGVKDRILNSGHIRANGGQVLLTAKSAGNVIGNVINHTGIIEAHSVQQKDGKIILSGEGPGNIQVSGVLDASNVQVTTGNEVLAGNSDFRNIFWNTDFDYAKAETRELTLSAQNDIVFNGSVFTGNPASGDSMNLNLNADSDRNGFGTVAVAAGKRLMSNNGDINIVARHVRLDGDLDSGKGDILFTLSVDLPLDVNLTGGDLSHITAQNMVLTTGGNIIVKGVTEQDTAGIADSVILNSGRNINFGEAASVFPGLQLFAINDINVNVDVTTTRSDFKAVADSENNGIGDFNVAPGVVITSARDIDITAPNINADESSFNETRNLILNGSVVGGTQSPVDTNSIQQGSLGTFLTEFFENGGSGGC